MKSGERDELNLTDTEFRLFTDYLRGRCGLHFDEETRYLVEKRLSRRIRDAEFGSFSSYFYQLRHGAAAEEEFSAIVDLLTTNETYFFREQSQLTALVEEIIPEMLARQFATRRPISIWSAGCSSGEERGAESIGRRRFARRTRHFASAISRKRTA
jgi:chemotaxis protein methyltransferase CheR